MRNAGWLMIMGACGAPSAPATAPEPAVPWLKGQLHVHTNRSGDSETPPAEVAAWYRAHGFDFIVLTDHNVVGGLAPDEVPAGLLVLPGVELTTNLQTCDPPDGDHPCLLHVNALVVDPEAHGAGVPSAGDANRERVYVAELALARRLGGIPHLNHPNFHFSASAALIAKLAGDAPLLVEIENQTTDSMNAGDASHPSTQVLWDQALALGATIYGTATDDAHHYADADRVRARGEPAYTGDRGWVMVHATPEAAAIRAALARGDFYASTGVTLESIAIDEGMVTVRAGRPLSLQCITS
ncbi:MAG: CehA/McbA family metallohydrolase, partial [Deltaproteobacteria bacterium]|nr:CehA/McbA family metallohydrolase [Deltaproteobacteria bacterium]